MARRSKSTMTEGFIEAVALLPWWGGVVLAVVSYLFLHHLAGQPLATAGGPGQMGAVVKQSMWRGLATVGQYILPMLFLLGAGLSAWRRRARSKLRATATRSDGALALDGLSWREFEQLVGEGFRRQGYQVVETGGGGADGGVDLVLSKDGDRFLVQCKHWKAYRVGVSVVRELYGVMAARGAAGGYVVTSGQMTDEAARFAQGRNVRLISGGELVKLIAQAPRVPGVAAVLLGVDSQSARVGSVPSCPVCSRVMVRRTAKRGSQVGGQFWGCPGFPECRGTRPL